MIFRVLAVALLLAFTTVSRGAEKESDFAAILAGVDGSGLIKQLQERQQKIEQLSAEERTALDAARKEAMEDPAVKAALAARNDATREFVETVNAHMVKNDPTLAVILSKSSPGASGQR